MGLPISIDIPGCDNSQAFDWAFARLRQIDKKFSTYKPDSEVSRYIKGEVSEDGLSPEFKNVIKACRRAEKLTDGYFSAWAAGAFDPNGYVKGWAISRAGEIIEKAGFKTYCIGAGGDILARSNTDKTWNIGIQDPHNKTEILNLLSISNGAVCTSGNYERGPHITNPITKKPADELLSVTIAGPDIVWADILATAVYAMGENGISFMSSQPGYSYLIVDKSGSVNSTLDI